MLKIAVTSEPRSTNYFNPIHNNNYPWCVIDDDNNVLVLCSTVNVAEQIVNPKTNRIDTNNWFHNGWMDGFSIISNKNGNQPVALCMSDRICNQVLNNNLT